MRCDTMRFWNASSGVNLIKFKNEPHTFRALFFLSVSFELFNFANVSTYLGQSANFMIKSNYPRSKSKKQSNDEYTTKFSLKFRKMSVMNLCGTSNFMIEYSRWKIELTNYRIFHFGILLKSKVVALNGRWIIIIMYFIKKKTVIIYVQCTTFQSVNQSNTPIIWILVNKAWRTWNKSMTQIYFNFCYEIRWQHRFSVE